MTAYILTMLTVGLVWLIGWWFEKTFHFKDKRTGFPLWD